MKKKVTITSVLAAMVYGGSRPAGTFALGEAALREAEALTGVEKAPHGNVPAGSRR